jgi:hypothetical protein
MPIPTSGRANEAVASATRKSVASASSKPPPRQWPAIALIVGWGSRAMRL